MNVVTAVYLIASTAALVVTSARLRAARRELARARDGRQEQGIQGEYGACYAYGVAMALACVLAGLAAAHWYMPETQRESKP